MHAIISVYVLHMYICIFMDTMINDNIRKWLSNDTYMSNEVICVCES